MKLRISTTESALKWSLVDSKVFLNPHNGLEHICFGMVVIVAVRTKVLLCMLLGSVDSFAMVIHL